MKMRALDSFTQFSHSCRSSHLVEYFVIAISPLSLILKSSSPPSVDMFRQSGLDAYNDTNAI